MEKQNEKALEERYVGLHASVSNKERTHRFRMNVVNGKYIRHGDSDHEFTHPDDYIVSESNLNKVELEIIEQWRKK